MIHTFGADTLTHLHEDMCNSLIYATEIELDMVTSVDVQKHNVLGYAESMAWKFDLKDMWLTKSRWSMMCNQYLDPEELQAWINTVVAKIGVKNRGIAVMRTKVVKPRGGAATGHTNKETRRWGSCMLAISYKAKPRPTITLHSRTSYLGYIGALDLSVAWMVGRYLAEAMEVAVEDFAFVWQIEAIQWHNFKSLAYMLNNPNPDDRAAFRRLLIKPKSKLDSSELVMLAASPAIGLSRVWLRKMMLADANEETYGDMTYNTYRRIRRRWHTEVLGYEKAQTFEGWSYYKQGPKEGERKEFFKAYLPLPSVPIETCNFSRLGVEVPHDIEFEGGGIEDEGDDDE